MTYTQSYITTGLVLLCLVAVMFGIILSMSFVITEIAQGLFYDLFSARETTMDL